ncbi:glycosyltransferase, partial [Candidatus Falkowbacteria bacterium]|nr:glycosyltransferase [Candidatus Falkowbacteria bacterium]
PGSLKVLYDYMLAHPKVGIVGPKLVDQFGKLNKDALPRRFPKLLDQICILLKISKLFPSCLKKYLYADLDATKEQEVDSVRGSFMFVRRELLDKLGWGFDPRYFIWFEDVDLCREAWTRGYKVVYNPFVESIDYVNQTFRHISFLQKRKWFMASMIKYFIKWHLFFLCPNSPSI